MQPVYPGIWKITLGQPEAHTPVRLFHHPPKANRFDVLPQCDACPIPEGAITGTKTRRGYTVEIPLGEEEQIYGLGLQLLSFNQRLKKKKIRVNSDPVVDLGDTHAPVPFYVSTAGYGILVDTARYATFYFGTAVPRPEAATSGVGEGERQKPTEIFKWLKENFPGPTLVDIPASDGVDVYIFAGPSLREAVQRYNLFSGGGCLPPRWGLGVWYRNYVQNNQEESVQTAEGLRQDEIPCDVFGLEPCWQSHVYSCSHVWNDTFPDPQGLLRKMDQMNFHLNLWTHAFTHPSSPIFEKLLPYSGDYQVWGGIVPDLLTQEGRQILAGQYSTHVDLGVSSYKLDECDSSDYNPVPWSFPELSQFPSGVDGEVMHSMFGMAYQETVGNIFKQRKQRTYGLVRSSHALASSNPFVLYSDLYKHKDFIRGVVNCGFSGLLWTPEVRDATSEEDLIRRMQVVVLSPMAQVDAWYIKNPPWKQWKRKENNEGMLMENYAALQAACQKILQLRMQLLPYLYTAFYRYHLEGIPPFRALVMDYPQDGNTFKLDDEWMIGDRILAAPLVAGETSRQVYLPAGDWFDFWTGSPIQGGQTLEVTAGLDQIPLYVRGHAVLPLAQVTQHTSDPASYNVQVRVYGDGSLPFTLFEDDDTGYAYMEGKFNRLELTWDAEEHLIREKRLGSFTGQQYTLVGWMHLLGSTES